MNRVDFVIFTSSNLYNKKKVKEKLNRRKMEMGKMGS